jgi:hypothetical protein
MMTAFDREEISSTLRACACVGAGSAGGGKYGAVGRAGADSEEDSEEDAWGKGKRTFGPFLLKN